MDDEWLPLTQAIETACEAGLAKSTAIPRIIGLAKDQEVRSRIALEIDRYEGQPKPNVEMSEAHWRDLEKFDSDWIGTGNAEWRDGYAWRGIEIHARDLAIALGTKGKHSHTNLQPVAPPYHGGTDQHKRLEGIAVPDAIRLNDAVVDLANNIRSGPPLSEAERALELRFYSSDNDAMREYQIRDIAMYYISEAIRSGRLVLYTMLATGAHPIDRYSLRELTFRTLRSGTYMPTNKLSDPLVNTALWILNPDWEAFRQANLAERAGEPEPPMESASNAKPRRGRAKGTGFQKADAPLLAKMAKAIKADDSLNATSAAKLFADEAKGASFDAKVDRLSRAYRAGRKGE